MAIRKIKNKVQNSRAALQSKHRTLDELRALLREQLGKYFDLSADLEEQLLASRNAEVRHNAASKALDAERERLDGVFAARLQQARNEVAQLSGQVDSLTVRCRRAELAAENSQEYADRCKDKADAERNWSLFAYVVLLAQTVYYEEWYVPVVEFVKGLL